MELLQDSDQGGAFLERHERALEDLNGISVRISEGEVQVADLSGRNVAATDWQMGGTVGSMDRPASDSTATTPVDAMATVNRLSELVLRETALVRHHISGSMAVMLRPDEHTELFVHFTQASGQLQATIRCERGDFQQLNALWPQLQETLAQQKISLARLQESSNHFNHAPGSGRESSGGRDGSDRQARPEFSPLDERPGSADSSVEPASARGRRESGVRLTPGRPGWETWA